MAGEDRHGDRLTPRNVGLNDEAIDWIVLLGSESATDADRAAFDRWQRRSPAHTAAAAEAATLLDRVGETRQADEYRHIGAALRAPMASRSRRVTRRTMLAGGVSAVAVGVVSTGTLGPPSALWADHATRIGDRKRVALADGSAVWLNTATAISVDYTAAERRVTLHEGEALFEVAQNPARPFIVRSGGGEARAIGTAYAVRRRGSISDVIVTSGVVEVRNGDGTTRLVAGQRVAYGDGIRSAVVAIDGSAATAWSRGKLIFNRRPLDEVAAELERYRLGKVVVRGQRLKRLEVTGVFDLDDDRAMFQAIATQLRVPVLRYPLLAIIG